MNADEIEREVRRLAPWYYLWDLGGVRTDITPPCDERGHRQVACPPIFAGFWAGKSVLDVACNEGAYGLGALAHGARELVGFDSRPRNIEKARFVARMMGCQHATFEVATCDSWLRRHGDRRYDIVLLCGILYHLVDPVRTIRDFCGIAREWVFVTCCVQGTERDGYTWTKETENVAASDGARDSLMPNNGNTLIAAFAEHGFVPVHVEEVCEADFWDGVNILFRSCRAPSGRRMGLAGAADDVLVHLAPEPGDQGTVRVHIAISNRIGKPLRVCARLRFVDRDGSERGVQTEILDLPARSVAPTIPASASVHRTTVIPADLARPVSLAVQILDGERLRGGACLTLD